jgi:hypothetical protein
MQEPFASQRRSRLGCFWGTFSPSRRQTRSTRVSLTSQPALRSNAGRSVLYAFFVEHYVSAMTGAIKE